MARKSALSDSDDSLVIRAAWLHYAGGLTQAAVAERLGLPSVKTHRLIARAVADGMVKVSIDGDIVECVDLEMRLAARYGLDYCELAPDLGEEGLPLFALGLAGASFLRREIERREIKEISADGGVGEMLGHFFDSCGRVLETMLTARTLAVSMARDGTDSIVAIAGGASKIAAIRAVLASRRLKGLITDERTAEMILEQD